MRKSTTLLIPILMLVSIFCAYGQSIDGEISAGEYPSQLSFSNDDYKLHWRVNGDEIVIGMEGKTVGWVAIGLEPSQAMQDADMIFGWVDGGGKAAVLDCFATGLYGPHPPDTELDGTSSILEFDGKEAGGLTVIEVSRKLQTGDSYDKDLKTGANIKIIWALGWSDDFNDDHSNVGYATLNLESAAASKAQAPFLMPVHAIIMSFGFASMFTGMIISRYMKKKKWWLKTHKSLGVAGASLGVIALATAVYMVATTSGIHLRVVHSYFGLITLIIIVLTPIMGQTFLKIKKNKKVFRMIHRWAGRTSLLLMLATIVLGLVQIRLFS